MTTPPRRLARLWRRSPEERWVAVRFATRRWLARLPFLPVPVRVPLRDGEAVTFWWSYVLPGFEPDRKALDYRGPDLRELQFLCRVSKPGMCMLDIGAYHGLYSVVAGRKMRGRGRIVLFEPSPRERSRIRTHLRLNRLPATVEPLALSSRRGSSRFFVVLSGLTTMNSLSRPPTEHPTGEIEVETITVDEYCREKDIRRVDLVKIDAEGAEMDVFRGAEWLLTTARPLLICEVLDWVTQPRGYPAREIVAHLTRLDYEWFEFRADGRLEPHRERSEYPEVRNYLAVPREALARIDGLRVGLGRADGER